MSGSTYKRGGRKAGVRNKRTLEYDELYDGLVKKYGDPIETLFDIGHDPNIDAPHRVKALNIVANLKHPTKKAVQVEEKSEKRVTIRDMRKESDDVDIAS